ncbi:MAG: hypothetical protein ACRD3I_05150, partial [Terriglobales bacterium]
PGAEGKMKQFVSWFTHGVAGGSGLRKAVYEARTAKEILEQVERFFEEVLHCSMSLGASATESAAAQKSARVGEFCLEGPPQ